MNETLDFKNPAFQEKVLQIHTLVSIEIARCLNQAHDQFWLKKQACKRAINLIEALDDLLLGDVAGSIKAYLEKHACLLELIRELKQASLICEKVTDQFGAHCFFIQPLIVDGQIASNCV